MCAVAARLARVLGCCVTSPADREDDNDVITTRLSRRRRDATMVPKTIPDVIADVDLDSVERSTSNTDWTSSGYYSVNDVIMDTGGGNEDRSGSGPELVCCCERCDSISGWLIPREDLYAGVVAGDRTGVEVKPLRLRNCLLACEVDRLRQRRTATVTMNCPAACRGEDLSACTMKDTTKMTCSLLGAAQLTLNNQDCSVIGSTRWSPQSELTSCYQPPPNRTIGHLYVVADAGSELDPVDDRFCSPRERLHNSEDHDESEASSTLCCLRMVGSSRSTRQHPTTRREQSPMSSQRVVPLKNR